jgi:hypothetical protein
MQMPAQPNTKVRVPPSTREVLKEQAANAERERQRKAEAAKAAAKPIAGTGVVPAGTTAVAVPDNRTPHERYLDEIAPASIVGRLMKFSKEGTFVTADDDEPILEGGEFVALCDQTLVGWLKFNNDAPPDRVMGLLYDGFNMPRREELGNLNKDGWPAGLSGAPEDPWRHHIYLVLQNGDSGELFTFATSSMTGRRAVGNLLRHYDRMRRTHPNELPVVRLKTGGFNHRDERIGWVSTPVFAVCGRAPQDSVAKPNTSLSADMNDAVPF